MKKLIIIQSILVVAMVAAIEYFRTTTISTEPIADVETEVKSLFSIGRVLLSVVIGFFLGAAMEGFFEALFNLEKRDYGTKISMVYFILATAMTYWVLWQYW